MVIAQLRSAGVGVWVDVSGPDQPAIVYWGADLGDLSDAEVAAAATALTVAVPHGVQDLPVRVGVLPEASAGYRGRPGLAAFRPGRALWPKLTLIGVEQHADADGGTLEIRCADEEAGLVVRSTLRLDPAGVLHVDHELTNSGDSDLELSRLAVVLPLPAAAQEISDFTGK